MRRGIKRDNLGYGQRDIPAVTKMAITVATISTQQEVTAMSQNLSNSRIKLPHIVIVKAPGLLPMLYTVRELAEELSMPERTLRDWLLHGAPHTRDRLGHIWVNGQAFAAWVASQRKKASSSRLKPGEGYCMFCNQIVMMLQPTRRPSVGRLVYIQGNCPQCNSKVSRGARRDSSQ
jgi:hypothetical protein